MSLSRWLQKNRWPPSPDLAQTANGHGRFPTEGEAMTPPAVFVTPLRLIRIGNATAFSMADGDP
ncbi:hypothetical protein ACRE_021540 [Hapsidospora chrysogenum ATCC 11550]|uniref:Uncharacterized protein n=1 Tax=Hapsidospora chrysogenum (strain ATCC 11550 / CBS 779.69 / DSM 880 / IAM 14645 / JCM 23072 / IMI 49137) TaxID=857340 RepID=A0A086TCF8_HAPC1|nr:hypothetical protein ACRE_021540 [Hapsidospora chrysogenum ATCC 11550]